MSVGGQKYFVPDRRLVRARSVRAIMKYAGLLKGHAYVHQKLAALELRPEDFANPDALVSPLAGDDLLTMLAQDGFSDLQMRQMGAMTLLTARKSVVGQAFAVIPTPKQLYEELHERQIHNYDQIWQYPLTRLTAHGCTTRITPREEMADLFHTRRIGSRRMCVFRQGVYAAVLGNIGSRLARVTESSCIYHGDSSCTYRLDWT